MDLEPYDFDQSPAGWRQLDSEGKYIEAAELIVAYIKANRQKILNQDRVSIQTMCFHAGQAYAMAGADHYDKAVAQFLKSHKGREDWDIYVDGTIAFLQGDSDKLGVLADRLKGLAANDEQLLANANLLSSLGHGLSVGKDYANVYDAAK